MRSRFRTVSTRVSPLMTEEVPRGEVEGVGAEALLGDFEGGAGAGGSLEEEVHHQLAPQGGDLLHGPAGDLQHLFGRVQDEGDLRG